MYGNWEIELSELDITNFYCKFDVYCDKKNDFFLDFDALYGMAQIYIDFLDEKCYFDYKSPDSNREPLYDISDYLIEKSINSFFVHYNRGTRKTGEEATYWENGSVELVINDFRFKTDFNRINFAMATIYLSPENKSFEFNSEENFPVSNIIISDEEINEKEQIVILPVSATDTDMTNNGDGSYTATTEDQYILQTVDVTNLITKLGGKSEVTSIVLAGLPAYKTSDGLSSLTSLENINNSLVEGTTKTLNQYYSGDEYYLDEYKIFIPQNVENLTLKDLTGKQYGFKVGV